MKRSAILLLLLALTARPAGAGPALPTRESALADAFPGATEVAPVHRVLTEAQADRIRALSGSAPESRLLTLYEGRAGGQLLGTATFDTHVVRSSPETVLVVLDPAGNVAGVHLVAFHEPEEYRPPEVWLHRFAGRVLDRELAVGRGVDAISGATLTAHAVAAAVRRALAIHRVTSEAGPS